MTEIGTRFSNRFKVGERAIGVGEPALIIAEVSQNHCGISSGQKHVDAAKNTGCDCVKFQTFTAEEMCADREKLFTYWSQGKKLLKQNLSYIRDTNSVKISGRKSLPIAIRLAFLS